jgi:DedD protein
MYPAEASGMENRMRDLEQIQEQDGDERGRKIGTVIMATLSVVGLTFALGVVVGKAAEPKGTEDSDPLAKLVRTAEPSVTSAPAAAAAPDAPTVKAENLTFPSALADEEDRPEVEAALKAAAAEAERLDQADPPTEPVAPGVIAHVSVPAQDAEEADDAIEITEENAEAQFNSTMPAAVAAGSIGDRIRKSVKHDTMLAKAISKPESAEAAPVGSEGEYSLQVVSYDSAASAKTFAAGLRAKGHQAYVTSADVPDRGRYYRVRIGPFANKQKAEGYRRKFEDEEQMNTIVVRKPKDENAG